jgi:dUTPase
MHHRVAGPSILTLFLSVCCFHLSVGVILFNHSDVDFHVKAGDRVAQLILEKIAIAEVEEVEGELTNT